MNNGVSHWNQPSWSHTYYHQYMQQHTQLSQWLQQVHQNASLRHPCAPHCGATPQNFGHSVTRYNCCASHAQPINVGPALPINMGHVAPVYMSHAYPPAQYYPVVEPREVDNLQEPRAGYAYGEEKTEEGLDGKEDSEDGDDEEDSEGEFVFNVDAILAMRATREVSEPGSENSFEILDSMNDDMQEYVKLDAYGNVERLSGRLGEVNAHEEELNHKGQLKLLYGDRAASIGGIEALTTVQFDHLYDTLQPPLWPVLALVL